MEPEAAMRATVGLLLAVALGGCAESHGAANVDDVDPDGSAVIADGGYGYDSGVDDSGVIVGDGGAATCPPHGISALRLWSNSPQPGCPDGLGWWLDPESTSIVPARCEAVEETCAAATWICEGPVTAPPGSTAEIRLSLGGAGELRMFDVDGVQYCHGIYDLTIRRDGRFAVGAAWWNGPIGPGT